MAWFSPHLGAVKFCFIFFFSFSAFAQEKELWKKEVTRLLKEGKSFAEAGRWKLATVKFLAAFDLFKHLEKKADLGKEKEKLNRFKTSLFYFLGRSYQAEKKPLQAFHFYLRCLKNEGQGKFTKPCGKGLRALRSVIPPAAQTMLEEAVFPSAPPSGQAPPKEAEAFGEARVVIQAYPLGIEVYKGRTFLGRLTSPTQALRLPPGSYVLSFRKKGYLTMEENVELAAGIALPLTIELKPKAAPSASHSPSASSSFSASSSSPKPPREPSPLDEKERRFEVSLGGGGGTGGGGFLCLSWRVGSVFSVILVGGASYGIADLEAGFALRSLIRGFVAGGFQILLGETWRFALRVAPGFGFGQGGLGFSLFAGLGLVYRFGSGLLLGLTADGHWLPAHALGSLLGLGVHLNLGYAF